MARRPLPLALVIASLVACSGQGDAPRRATVDTDQANDTAVADTSMAATAADGAPGSIMPGGAVDILRREGWRVETGHADAVAGEVAGNSP